MSTGIVMGLSAVMLYWLIRANSRLDEIIDKLNNEGGDDGE